jgi:hypothetical protein
LYGKQEREVIMCSKATHQELFVVMKDKYIDMSAQERRADIHACVEIIEKHGGDLMDIYRHEPVIAAVVPLDVKETIINTLKDTGTIETVFEGLKLNVLCKDELGTNKFRVALN